MIFEFGTYRIDADIESTRAFYRDHAVKIADACDCADCQNFDKAIRRVSADVLHFFDSLGIAPCKGAEVYNVTGGEPDTNGLILYHGFYHLSASLSKGDPIWIPHEKQGKRLNMSAFYALNEHFRIGFTEEVELLEDNFPKPCIQLEILVHLPWILDSKY
jgi:hypothetical protein